MPPKQWDSIGVMKMENIKQELMQLPIVKKVRHYLLKSRAQ